MSEWLEADSNLVPPHARVLAAVSSGADSMALLLWLHRIGCDVVVGHVNHDLRELRSGDCERDETFVRERCASLGIPFVSQTVVLPRKNGHVNEEVAREARYISLLELARANGCDRVATAHTATDSLETALLNLMRGAGPQGFLGVAPQRELGEGVLLVRPLWNVPRDQPRQLLTENHWSWREDASNRAPEFRRNRVRHELLPLLQDISGQNSDDLALRFVKNAAIARDEARWMEEAAATALEALTVKRDDSSLSLDGEKFASLDVALQRRLLRLAARQIYPDARDLSLQKIETTRFAVATQQKRAVWVWRSTLYVEWTGGSAGNRIRFWRVRSNVSPDTY